MPEIDETTNLPVVPEGYFWSVNLYWGSYDRIPSVTVSLRKHRRFGSKLVSSLDDYLAVQDTNNTAYVELIRLLPGAYPNAIQKLAEKVLKKNEKQLRDEAYYDSFSAAKKKLSGEYPPKRLED